MCPCLHVNTKIVRTCSNKLQNMKRAAEEDLPGERGGKDREVSGSAAIVRYPPLRQTALALGLPGSEDSLVARALGPVGHIISKFHKIGPKTKDFNRTDVMRSLQRVAGTLTRFTLHAVRDGNFQRLTARRERNLLHISASWDGDRYGWKAIAHEILDSVELGTIEYEEDGDLVLSIGADHPQLDWDPEEMQHLRRFNSEIPRGSMDADDMINTCIQEFCDGSVGRKVVFTASYDVKVTDSGPVGDGQISVLQLCQMQSTAPAVHYRRLLNGTQASISFIQKFTAHRNGENEVLSVDLTPHSMSDRTKLHFLESFGNVPPSETEAEDAGLAVENHARARYMRSLFDDCMPEGVPYTWTWKIRANINLVTDSMWNLLVPDTLSKRWQYNFLVKCTNTAANKAALEQAALLFMMRMPPLFPGSTSTEINGQASIKLGEIVPDHGAGAAEWDPRKSQCMYALKQAFGVAEFDPRDRHDSTRAQTGFLGLTGPINLTLPEWIHPVPYFRGGRRPQSRRPRSRSTRQKRRGTTPKRRRKKSRSARRKSRSRSVRRR